MDSIRLLIPSTECVFLTIEIIKMALEYALKKLFSTNSPFMQIPSVYLLDSGSFKVQLKDSDPKGRDTVSVNREELKRIIDHIPEQDAIEVADFIGYLNTRREREALNNFEQ